VTTLTHSSNALAPGGWIVQGRLRRILGDEHTGPRAALQAWSSGAFGMPGKLIGLKQLVNVLGCTRPHQEQAVCAEPERGDFSRLGVQAVLSLASRRSASTRVAFPDAIRNCGEPVADRQLGDQVAGRSRAPASAAPTRRGHIAVRDTAGTTARCWAIRWGTDDGVVLRQVAAALSGGTTCGSAKHTEAARLHGMWAASARSTVLPHGQARPTGQRLQVARPLARRSHRFTE